MKNFVFQPISNPLAQEHFFTTIKHGVNISELKSFISDSYYKQLASLYPTGNIRVWGVTNGKNNVNERKWQKISSGDVVLFFGKGGVSSCATITATLKSKDLAKFLWGTDSANNCWENIYFLNNICEMHIPYKHLNNALNYKENYVVHGFSVLGPELNEKITAEFNL